MREIGELRRGMCKNDKRAAQWAEDKDGTDMASLPLIDISPFLDPSTSAENLQSTADKIHEACLKAGFFYLTGHGVPLSDQDSIISTTRSFLEDGTEAEKEELSITKNDHARGYQRKGDNVTQGKPDWHEAIDLYAPSPFGDQEGKDQVLGGHNKFPSRPVNFRSVVENWVDRMCSLGLVVMRATAMGLGLTSDQTETYSIRFGTHSGQLNHLFISFLPKQTYHWIYIADYHLCFIFSGFCDVLVTPLYHPHTMAYPAVHIRGSLQVYVAREEGGHGQEPEYHWIEANPVEGAFGNPTSPSIIISEFENLRLTHPLFFTGQYRRNVGDMDNGLYKATLHRVIHKSDNYRVSVPFFYEPAFDAIVSPLPAAIALQERLQGVEKGGGGDRQATHQVW
ncbi:hypothetical protein PSTT_00366 [Puccinia striiformis]|uniref:Non-haem dioxygenase N-terminal domain-containing protein n=1 Tax=Puccinia striiformis TaxID=27350 RepID=A0A2S4W7D8_9BASI|nr:hypothetical protein PSTT_00366 [Puccinia striiformis]